MTEGPYKLPEGWHWVRLGEVCRYDRRTVDPRRSPQRTFYLYSIPAYDKGQRPERLDGSQIGSSKVVIGPGVCLFSKLNPRIPRAWVVAGVPQDGVPVASTEFMPLRPNPNGLDLDYLGKLLVTEGFLSQVRPDVTGATGSRQRSKPEVILNALIPLPPLDEQRRIVARVEELMARVREAKRLRQQAKEDAERLMQAALAEVFPRPGAEPPTGWRWVRLGEVANIVSGFGFPKRFQGKPVGPIPFIKVSDLGAPENDPHIQAAANYVDEQTLRRLKARAYDPGTVVFPKIGGAIATNKKRILGVRATFDNNIMGAIPLPDRIIPRYLLAVFSTIDLNGLAENGPVPSIRKSTVQQLVVPLPPLAEQRRIVAQLEAVQEEVKALKEVQATTEAELQRLEQAILDKAFRGEL